MSPPPRKEKATLLARKPVFDGRIVHLSVDTVRFPDGSTGDLELIRHAGASAVVPFLDDPLGPDPRVVLLEQYRYAAGGVLRELPAGIPLSEDEHWEACARRELAEETGFQAEDVRYLTRIYTTPGFTDEVIHLFAAAGLGPGMANPDADEFLEVVTVPLSTALEWIGTGRIVDAKSISALLFCARFLPSVWPEKRRPPERTRS